MGQDKALLAFQGGTVLSYILDQVKDLSDDIGIITNRPAGYESFGLPLYADKIAGWGALGGLHTALSVSPRPYCLLLACDMPFIKTALLEHLINLAENHDAVVPKLDDRFAEPFRAVYHRRCLAAVQAAIAREQRRVISFFNDIDVRYVHRAEIETFDPGARSFFNVNTPEQFSQAEVLASDWPSADS